MQTIDSWPRERLIGMNMRCVMIWMVVLTVDIPVQAAPVKCEWTGTFAPTLSEYNLFADPVAQIPNDGLVPYDIITPLFSDYAHKRRFIFVPDGEVIDYSEASAFAFPVGSMLVKTFFYPVDFRQPDGPRRLIETRLLVHTKNKGWTGAAYVWNSEQSDAGLMIAGRRLSVEWIHHDGSERSTRYAVPNMNQCRFCHAGVDRMLPLSPTARQLNRDFIDDDGQTQNQLAEWTSRGILRGAPTPESVPRAAKWDDPESGSVFERVRSYFDTNCSHCHNPGGLAGSKRIDLSYDQTELWRLGVNLRSTGGSHAASGLEKVIVAGHPERSSVFLRMKSKDFTFMMPQLSRSVVHQEGVELIANWIRSLRHEQIGVE